MYIYAHIQNWYTRKYKSFVNAKNLDILKLELFEQRKISTVKPQGFVNWITDELIQTHRSRLIQKEIEKEDKIKNDIKDLYELYLPFDPYYEKAQNKIFNYIKYLESDNNYQYRNLFPNTPTNLNMRYDWRADNNGL
jgi:hypothetical protein